MIIRTYFRVNVIFNSYFSCILILIVMDDMCVGFGWKEREIVGQGWSGYVQLNFHAESREWALNLKIRFFKNLLI